MLPILLWQKKLLKKSAILRVPTSASLQACHMPVFYCISWNALKHSMWWPALHFLHCCSTFSPQTAQRLCVAIDSVRHACGLPSVHDGLGAMGAPTVCRCTHIQDNISRFIHWQQCVGTPVDSSVDDSFNPSVCGSAKYCAWRCRPDTQTVATITCANELIFCVLDQIACGEQITYIDMVINAGKTMKFDIAQPRRSFLLPVTVSFHLHPRPTNCCTSVLRRLTTYHFYCMPLLRLPLLLGNFEFLIAAGISSIVDYLLVIFGNR
jgi:hypothetical protein